MDRNEICTVLTESGPIDRFGFRPDEPPSEATLDAEVPERDRGIERRGRFDNAAVLDMERQGTSDSAIRADRVGSGLLRFVPAPGGAQIELALGHERPGR